MGFRLDCELDVLKLRKEGRPIRRVRKGSSRRRCCRQSTRIKCRWRGLFRIVHFLLPLLLLARTIRTGRRNFQLPHRPGVFQPLSRYCYDRQPQNRRSWQDFNPTFRGTVEKILKNIIQSPSMLQLLYVESDSYDRAVSYNSYTWYINVHQHLCNRVFILFNIDLHFLIDLQRYEAHI